MKRLRQARLLLLTSLLTLGCVVGLTLGLLAPDGSVRARHPRFGPSDIASHGGGDLVAVGADRRGGECRIQEVVEHVVIRDVPVPGCHAYEAPAIIPRGETTLIVWERNSREIAVSTLRQDLTVGPSVFVPRPERAGAFEPRTAVRVDAERLAIWYGAERVLSVGPELSTWPGGLLEVVDARMGPRAWTIIAGTFGLLFFYLLAASWRLRLPGRLRRARAEGRCVETTLPARGRAVVLGGHSAELDLGHAFFHGGTLAELGDASVTLVLPPGAIPGSGEGYRTQDRTPVTQVWAGEFSNALALARAIRARTFALVVFATATLGLGLDAYLAL